MMCAINYKSNFSKSAVDPPPSKLCNWRLEGFLEDVCYPQLDLWGSLQQLLSQNLVAFVNMFRPDFHHVSFCSLKLCLAAKQGAPTAWLRSVAFQIHNVLLLLYVPLYLFFCSRLEHWEQCEVGMKRYNLQGNTHVPVLEQRVLQ